MPQRIVLAYSGGLDTSVAIQWLKEHYGAEVLTFTVDLSGGRDLSMVERKALKAGASKAIVREVVDEFIADFVWPSLQGDAMYQEVYPLATALARPLMVKLLAEVAREEGADTVAHGCTGKGNDQVRFDVGLATLAPDLKIIAPAREWGMNRQQTIEYARAHAIPVAATVASPYSIDENIWGRSIECGILEDPWQEPPEDAFAWTCSPSAAPDEAAYVEIGFERGLPITLDGVHMTASSLIHKLNELAGRHGVGRIDHIEDRLVGIKSREVYEAPAALVLHVAHRALESLTLSRQQISFKHQVAAEYASVIYNGLWFSAHRQDLASYISSTERFVTGAVRLKLFKGSCIVVGRKSPYSLYQYGLATYDSADQFDHRAAVGFISLWGLPAKVQAQAQPLWQSEYLGSGEAEKR